VFYWKKEATQRIISENSINKTPARPHLIKHIGTGFPSFWRDKRLNTHTHILETSWPTTGLSWCAWKTANLRCSVSVSLISWLPNFKEKARQRNRQAKYLKHEYFNNIAGNIHRCFVFINRLSCKRNAVRRRRAILMMSYIAEPVFAPGKGHSASVRMQSLL